MLVLTKQRKKISISYVYLGRFFLFLVTIAVKQEERIYFRIICLRVLSVFH